MADPVDVVTDPIRLAFDLSPVGMVMTDAAGKITLVNRELLRLFGYERDELIGRPIEELVPERHRSIHPRHRARFHQAPSDRAMGAGRELFARRKDGSEFAVEIALKPVPAEGGTFVIGSIVDIGERRRLEAQLRHVQKMDAIGTLAGGIAHDFNNVLSAILGYTEAALEGARDRPQVAEDLDQVRRAAERGRQLVQGILAFGRRRESRREAVSLAALLGEVVPLLRATLPSTVEIRPETPAEVPAVMADSTQMHQILVNLATNGARAMGSRGGRLEISVAPVHADTTLTRLHPNLQAGPHVRIRVKDEGEGMTPEVQARAFEPFFTTRPPGEGTGLGLAVVHGIVMEHGGAIGIQSAPGAGTTVSVYLPQVELDPELVPDSSGEPPRGSGQRVLFVDDEPALTRLWTRMLENIGYTVEAFPTATAALEVLRARPQAFDAVITDHTMPGMTGVALAEEIQRYRPGLPVLLMSGYAEGVAGEVAERGLVRRVIAKPFSTLVIAEALREALGEPSS